MENRVRKAWATIERVLEHEVPSVFQSLRPPATEQQLLDLQKALGRAIPEDLLESLRLHDGQDGKQRETLFDGEWILPVDRILEYWRMRNEIQKDNDSFLAPQAPRRDSGDTPWWDARYIPFTDSDGDAYCVDSASPAGPVIQHIHDQGMDSAPEYSSFIEFLEALASCFEAGHYTKEYGSLWPDMKR